MNASDRLKTTFLLLIVLQALHSTEEFIFKLYEAFPPMRLLYASVPRLAPVGFIIFNSLLITAGLLCFYWWVRPGGRAAYTVVWIWTVVEILNAMAHGIWAIIARGYVPGLVTGLGFVPVTAYLVYLLRHSGPGGAG